MIQLHNVGKHYPAGHEALHDVSFTVERGEMVFVTGHSGAGKSTLLKLMGVIERPSAGELIVNDRNLGRLSKRQIPYHRRTLGMIYQDFRLLGDRSIFDNVALPLVIAGHYDQQEIRRRARAALDKVGLLGKEKLHPLELSGGEQQRVGIARAVVHKPVLLLADEPTGNLDPTLAGEIMALFEAFNQVGVTVLIASHNVELIARLQRRVLVLNNGRLVSDGYGGRSHEKE
jgi:cell division transport system ATP-binding protein